MNNTSNEDLAKMVGATMRDVDSLAAKYHKMQNNNPSLDNGFIALASQSLSAGVTMIKNKLSRYAGSVQSMKIAFRNSTDENYKRQVQEMLNLVHSIQDNLKKLDSTELPIYMTDKESCQVGIGYYSINKASEKVTQSVA